MSNPCRRPRESRVRPDSENKILLFGPNPRSTSAIAETLLRSGASVQVASTKEEALSMLQEDSGFRLIFCVQPEGETSGVDLLEEVSVRWPTIKRVLAVRSLEPGRSHEDPEQSGSPSHLWIPWHDELLETILFSLGAAGSCSLQEDKTRLVEEIGELAAGLAHDLNNPLAGILAFSQLMSRDDDRSAEDLEQLGYIEESARKCVAIIESLLAAWRPWPHPTWAKPHVRTNGKLAKPQETD